MLDAWNDAKAGGSRDDAAPAVAELHFALQLRKHVEELRSQLLVAGWRIHQLAVDAPVEVVTHGAAATPGNSIIPGHTKVVEHVDVVAKRMA